MIVTNIDNSNGVLIDLSVRCIDASNSEQLYYEVSRSLLKSKNIIIDLRELELMDSSGLGMLLNCYRDIKSGGGDMLVVANNPLVLSLFNLVHFNKITEVHKTMANAIESLKEKYSETRERYISSIIYEPPR
jgi:anti-sigma B factor antagonist